MPSLYQQSMGRHPLHTHRILKKFLQSENLVRGAATWMKSTLSIFQRWFQNFSEFLFKAVGMLFLQGEEVIFFNNSHVFCNRLSCI